MMSESSESSPIDTSSRIAEKHEFELGSRRGGTAAAYGPLVLPAWVRALLCSVTTFRDKSGALYDAKEFPANELESIDSCRFTI